MWHNYQRLIREYQDLGIMDAIDYEKFCMISIVYHSTRIEGCSLTETDTRVLLDKSITAQGKPLADHLMVKDHFNAFLMIREEARIKRKLSMEFIRLCGSMIMRNTGGIVRTIGGDFDTSAGDLRLAQVYVDKKYFPDFKKVPELLKNLIEEVNLQIDNVMDEDILKLAADVHYRFVNIHPFADGNGRTARLLMNYIMLYHHMPLIKVFTEDRAEYIDALNNTEDSDEPGIFRDFICRQEIKFLESEIEKFNRRG